MKIKFFSLLFFLLSTSSVMANPIYKHDDPKIQREFEEVYRNSVTLSSSSANFISISSAIANFSQATISPDWICFDTPTFCIDKTYHHIRINNANQTPTNYRIVIGTIPPVTTENAEVMLSTYKTGFQDANGFGSYYFWDGNADSGWCDFHSYSYDVGEKNHTFGTGFISAPGHTSQGTLQNLQGFYSRPSQQNGSVYRLEHYYAGNGQFAVGSTTTWQFGLFVEPLDTAQWNYPIYIAGANPSLFSGPIFFSDPSLANATTTASAITWGGIDRVQINKYLLIPYQPTFIAQVSVSSIPSVTGDNTIYTIIYDNEIKDSHADYNPATGVFTAPFSGTYLFTTSNLISGLSTTSHTELILELITSNRNYRLSYINQIPANLDFYTCSGSQIADMDAGDTAYINLKVSAGNKDVSVSGGNINSTFSGTLMN